MSSSTNFSAAAALALLFGGAACTRDEGPRPHDLERRNPQSTTSGTAVDAGTLGTAGGNGVPASHGADASAAERGTGAGQNGGSSGAP